MVMAWLFLGRDCTVVVSRGCAWRGRFVDLQVVAWLCYLLEFVTVYCFFAWLFVESFLGVGSGSVKFVL